MKQGLSGLILIAAVAFSACGGGPPTFAEYMEDVAAVLNAVDARLDAHASELFSGSQTVPATRDYLADRVAGYEEMIEGVEPLDPPEDAADLHERLVEILRKTYAAEQDLAEFADTLEADADPALIWDSPESGAVQAAELEAIDICYAAQDLVDETQDREGVADLPWIPPDMKEVVRVAFGCPEGLDA